MITKNIQAFAFILLTVLSLASCNKEIETAKVVNVGFHGYNLSDDQLEATFDTVVYNMDIIQPNGPFNLSKVYPYFPGKNELRVQIKNKTTGAELLQKTVSLSSGQLEFFFPFVYVDGKVIDVTPPPADPATNKLGFYIHYPDSNDPIDISLYNLNTGEQLYLAKNIVPGTWVYTDYLPSAGFLSKADIQQCVVYFTKAGTTEWAFNGDEYLSQAYVNSLYIPHKGYSLNKVQSYFVTPSPQGWQADICNLFPNPKDY
ncbi:hypothetical protein [Pedobacter metabolipauper]|uniref:DUF4843 domain-containing protein n=1 Tax=Pedobacter metabolipauper TaxID=425513 RepID=A0A4R6STD1_9SPHI|nr:hypothetical protein [Pedobacter metabolipauper]TDQ08268.1 hypothetical protein ATK78_2776 [Pedobacter metabolipauper]